MTDQTRAACIIGWPVEQSRSPIIHNCWAKAHGIDGAYRREAVTPEDFPDFVAHLAERVYVGGNCGTAPPDGECSPMLPSCQSHSQRGAFHM